MIPAGVIEDLKFRNRIEDVIGSYVTLTRSGANLKGLCPFHSEKSPSFTVYTGDGHFYCFGCGAGGDVISFIMRAENLDYRTALDFLAKRSGITLPDDESYKRDDGVTRKRVLEMNLCAAKYFRDVLYSAEGEPGRAYFEKRKLSGATVRHFGLGYAPNSFNGLREHLKRSGFTEEEMVAGYLCQKSRKNEKNIYDCFRGRVMYPIIDVTGNIVAFGGRVLDDSKPKYLNSADTPAFKKSRNLFALNYARNYCDNGFILCEGYMDVIALHAAGFQNAVATLGTAITPEQARMMKKYTDKVTISYDSDEAGQKAADKALRLLGEVGIEARVLKVPGAKDPDEYIKAFGSEAFAKVLTGSRSKFDYRIGKTLDKFDISDPEQKIRAARELCYAIADIDSRVERDVYTEKVASALSLNAKSIKSDVEVIIRKKKAAWKKEQRGEIIRETSGIGDRINPDFAKNQKAASLEEIVLGLMFVCPEYIEKTGKENLICPDDFATEFGRRVFTFVMEKHADGGFDFGMLSESFSQDEVSRCEKMAASRRKISGNTEKVFTEAVELLKKENEKIKRDERGGGDILEIINKRRSEGK